MEPQFVHEHVPVAVEPGSAVKEEPCISARHDGTYCLLVQPALTLGLARGDIFQIDPATLRPEVVQRSGNLVVWFYPERAQREAASLAWEAEVIGGVFEGSARDNGVFIFRLPGAATFAAIESVFDRFVNRHPEAATAWSAPVSVWEGATWATSATGAR